MIALFTDYGLVGPYVGQLKSVLHREVPDVTLIDLQHDAPAHDPRAAAYLLAALLPELPQETVVLAVVDPGVGTTRRGAIVRIDDRWLVGPDNGLFNVALLHARYSEWWDIDWRPPRLSSTFHGRDLFAPVAARLVLGAMPPGVSVRVEDRLLAEWPHDLAEIIYVDRFGNAMTGLRGSVVAEEGTRLQCRGVVFERARTFADVPEGQAFWYVNSIGLVELAAHRGSVAEAYGLTQGDRVEPRVSTK